MFFRGLLGLGCETTEKSISLAGALGGVARKTGIFLLGRAIGNKVEEHQEAKGFEVPDANGLARISALTKAFITKEV